MNNEEIMKNSVKSVKDIFTKYRIEHTIDGILCATSGFKMTEDDKEYFLPPHCTDYSDPWSLHVRVSSYPEVSISLICDSVGFHFYRIKDVWVRDQVGFWPARLELLQYVSHHTPGGLVYILPGDERNDWEIVTDDIIREDFTSDLIALVDRMARRPSRYNEK